MVRKKKKEDGKEEVEEGEKEDDRKKTGKRWKGKMKKCDREGEEKREGATIFILDKIGFKVKAVKRDKVNPIEESIQQEVVTVINIYAQIGAPK